MIVRESINFERGLDPRQAMEIGLKTWDKISPGYILKPKKEVYVSNKGNFAAEYGSADTIWQDMYIFSYYHKQKFPYSLSIREFNLIILLGF